MNRPPKIGEQLRITYPNPLFGKNIKGTVVTIKSMDLSEDCTFEELPEKFRLNSAWLEDLVK